MKVFQGQYARLDNIGPVYEVLLISNHDPDDEDDIEVATIAVVGSETNSDGEYIDVEYIGIDSLTTFDSSMGDWYSINKKHIADRRTM
jgi:hypothetical protein